MFLSISHHIVRRRNERGEVFDQTLLLGRSLRRASARSLKRDTLADLA
jgi:hypothetical protein